MGDDMRNIVKKIAFFQEELKKMPPKEEIQKTDRKEFTLLLSGISACKEDPRDLKTYGIPVPVPLRAGGRYQTGEKPSERVVWDL